MERTIGNNRLIDGAKLETLQVVSLLSGAGIEVTGTYPTFTITNTGGGGGGGVISVNGETGTVVLDSDDIDEGATNLYDKIVSLTAGTNITITGTYPDFTINASGGGGSGDMLTSTYDPQAIEADVFARTNHTGTQVASTISDFDTATGNTASVTANTLHRGAINNPHNVTATQVGLGNVDNTSDVDKPISEATQTALNNKENSFTKNSAFNKNFGTTAGTVLEGDKDATYVKIETTFDAGTSGTTKTINWDNGLTQRVSMTGNCTFIFSNPRDGQTHTLILTQDATGGRTITLPASVKTQEGAGITLSTTASKTDALTMLFEGTNYFANLGKQYE